MPSRKRLAEEEAAGYLGARRRLIEQHAAGGPQDANGVYRDPRCWSCGAIYARGSLRPPFTLGCPECGVVNAG